MQKVTERIVLAGAPIIEVRNAVIPSGRIEVLLTCGTYPLKMDEKQRKEWMSWGDVFYIWHAKCVEHQMGLQVCPDDVDRLLSYTRCRHCDERWLCADIEKMSAAQIAATFRTIVIVDKHEPPPVKLILEGGCTRTRQMTPEEMDAYHAKGMESWRAKHARYI